MAIMNNPDAVKMLSRQSNIPKAPPVLRPADRVAPGLSGSSTDADANEGPILRLYRNSANAADNDIIGVVEFAMNKDNAGGNSAVNRIVNSIVDATNGSEDASLDIQLMEAGTIHSRLFFTPGETVFNESSRNQFRPKITTIIIKPT